MRKKISLLFACIGFFSFTAIAQEGPKATKTNTNVKVAPERKAESVKVDASVDAKGPDSKIAPAKTTKRNVRAGRNAKPKSDVQHMEKSKMK